MRFNPALLMLPLLAACVSPGGITGNSTPPPRPERPSHVPPTKPNMPPPTHGFQQPQILRMAGLENVILKDAKSLSRMFGAPRLDVREGDMRKLQFGGTACVLDIYLYPTQKGAEPVATYVDARRESDGRDVDRAACVAALKR